MRELLRKGKQTIAKVSYWADSVGSGSAGGSSGGGGQTSASNRSITATVKNLLNVSVLGDRQRNNNNKEHRCC